MSKIGDKIHQYDNKQQTFIESLSTLQKKARGASFMRIDSIFSILAGKGYAALFIILSLPFCLPLQIPGFSTPFGLVLAFLALRYTFGKHLWWPKWVLGKKISGQKVEHLAEKLIDVVDYLKKISRPRMTFLTQNTLLHRLHGSIILTLSLLLLLPLPIPFTNMLTALPILCIGVGLLEDDGIFIIAGYVLSAICLIVFTSLAFLGKSAIDNMLGLTI